MSVKGLYTEYLGWAIPVASAVSLILSFLPGGSTGLSDSVHDRPVFPGISPAYGPVQFPVSAAGGSSASLYATSQPSGR